MKAWVNEDITAYRGALLIPTDRQEYISPTRDDPAELVQSHRDDGKEEIVWHGSKYLVFSMDLTFENS
jgi:hypothetical protein